MLLLRMHSKVSKEQKIEGIVEAEMRKCALWTSQGADVFEEGFGYHYGEAMEGFGDLVVHYRPGLQFPPHSRDGSIRQI